MIPKSWSIKTKLVLITTGICCSTLLVAGVATTFRDLLALRRAMVADLEVLAQVAGSSAQASLLFEDVESAEVTLGQLVAHPDILEARLYDAAGRPFADYRREAEAPSRVPATAQPRGHRFTPTHLEVFETVTRNGSTVGSICVIGGLDAFVASTRASASVLASVLALSALLAAILATRMQRLISKPILDLAEVATEIGKGNLSIRVECDLQDEVGVLAGALDQMSRNLGATTFSRNYVDRILESMVDSLIVLGTDRRIERVNRAACELLRYSEDELVGQPVEVIFSVDGATWPKLHEIYEKGFVKRSETVYRTKEGTEIPVALSAALMSQNGDGRSSMVCVARNIAERKEVERRLIEARETALEASRMKSEFLANMSHEIRTPLNGVIGMTDLALETSLTAEQREYLETVKTAGQSLLAVINDILDFSKIEAGRMEFERIPFFLRESIGEVLRTFASRAHEKGLELTLETSPELPNNVVGDSARLQQVLVNLVSNAIKFTHKGGVHLRVGLSAVEGQSVRVHFVVADSGIGVAEDKREEIFDAFAQADGSTTRRYGGTGLGLAICRQLVVGMGGRIWVESEPEKGSEFHFVLSLQLDPRPVETVGTPTLHELEGVEVLVVDDNPTNRRILVETLNRWRMRPRAVATGAEALETLATSGVPALVLLDAQMPGLSGFAVAARIRNSAAAHVPIIMLTSATKPDDRSLHASARIDGCLVKPVDTTKLKETICAVLGGVERRIEAPAVAVSSTVKGPRSLRVLLAEDNPVNRTVAAKKLEKRGHLVTVVEDGIQAVAAFKGAEFDVVLMDVQMPVMDGFEATSIIRSMQERTGRRVPVVALTAHALKGDRERCLAAGMDDYLTKPFKSEDLLRVVEESPKRFGIDDSVVSILNTEALLERVDGDEVLVIELVKTYYQEAPPLLRTLRDALAGSDVAAVGKAAHRLRGTLVTLGAEAAAVPAHRLEILSRDKNIDGAGAILRELEVELERLHPELSEWTRGVSSNESHGLGTLPSVVEP